MDKNDEEEVILLCGSPRAALPGSVKETCADCGCDIVRLPDPDVPDTAVKVCIPCGIERIAQSNEVPEIGITEQNERYLKAMGYRLKTEGSC